LADVVGLKELENEGRKLHRSLENNQSSIELDPAVWTRARKAYFERQLNKPVSDWINP
jgi:hypothetical protein